MDQKRARACTSFHRLHFYSSLPSPSIFANPPKVRTQTFFRHSKRILLFQPALFMHSCTLGYCLPLLIVVVGCSFRFCCEIFFCVWTFISEKSETKETKEERTKICRGCFFSWFGFASNVTNEMEKETSSLTHP